MIFRQFLHSTPVAASYVVGCGGRGVCVIVDPLDPIDTYLAAADAGRMRIEYVIDTHIHADHISAGRRLAEATGAAYVLHESARADAAQPVRDGDDLVTGNVTLQVWHTPGHTPEHICLVGSDRTRGPEPWFVLTGHTLMAGDMGRTELAGAADEGAHALFDSACRLRSLPDHIEVWPGAFAGSVCGRGLSGKPSTTIGFERRFNRTFGIEDRETFVRLMLKDIPPAPPRADEFREINLGRRTPVAATADRKIGRS